VDQGANLPFSAMACYTLGGSGRLFGLAGVGTATE